ncbi:MAG: primosomal protein N' [Ruminiclostridium sp.]|nr:primosomal protein N' [Ruminiclostridium sp.]
MKCMIAGIAVEKTAASFDDLFSYAVPEELRDKVCVGMRVAVPFGRSNKTRAGVIFTLSEGDIDGKLKSIISIADDGIILDREMLKLCGYLKETTFCTYYDAVRTMLPAGLSIKAEEKYALSEKYSAEGLSDSENALLTQLLLSGKKEFSALLSQPENKKAVDGLTEKGILIKTELIKRRVGDSTERIVTLTGADTAETRLSPKQKKVLETLSEAGAASVKELCYLCSVTESVVKNLAAKGLLEIHEEEASRAVSKDAVSTAKLSDIVFSDLQQRTFDGIKALMETGKPQCALLHGITGSGKTSVFIKLIEYARDSGKTAILMIPEISLTPQTVGKFQSLFGNTVAIIHSGLSLGQRADEYKRIRRGEAKIVIGTRSAVFAPLDNIGIIVMDEEGEHTYKSEMSPRYHARDVAKQRCFHHNALLLLASATPSFDSYNNALSGKYHLFEMNERYSNAVLPEVKMIDMRIEAENGNRGNFSEELLCELKYNLHKGEQSMLLLNRRGYHTYANCISCGAVVECPNCSVPLTYHKVNDSVICHICGFHKAMPKACEKCGSNYIYQSGTGTQRIEDEIKEYFPNARVLRMDADTTMSKFSYEKRFKEFRNNEYDIMIGTQMIAKGLDFENVTLVGVLLIDRSLYAGDYLGYEKTFSLVTQVVGRCGRGAKAGRAFIQTFTPDHYVLELAAQQNYKEFYAQETEVRKALIFPPYCDICMAGFSGANEAAVKAAADKFFAMLKAEADRAKDIPVIMLGPTMNGRINNTYRAKIIIKCRNSAPFREILRRVMNAAYKDPAFREVNFFVDFNGDLY